MDNIKLDVTVLSRGRDNFLPGGKEYPVWTTYCPLKNLPAVNTIVTPINYVPDFERERNEPDGTDGKVSTFHNEDATSDELNQVPHISENLNFNTPRCVL